MSDKLIDVRQTIEVIVDKTIHYLTDILIDELTAAINEKEDFHSYLQAHIFYRILNMLTGERYLCAR